VQPLIEYVAPKGTALATPADGCKSKYPRQYKSFWVTGTEFWEEWTYEVLECRDGKDRLSSSAIITLNTGAPASGPAPVTPEMVRNAN